MNKSKPLTELRDADIRRVDAVKGAANGARFLIAKSAAGEAGLVSDAAVRDLIADPPVADTYLDDAGAVIKAEPDTKRKEISMAASADQTPAEVAKAKPAFPGAKAPFGKKVKKEALAVLKAAKVAKAQARLAKKASKLAKASVIAKANDILGAAGLRKSGMLSSLGEAHQAVLEALKNEADEGDEPPEVMTHLQSLADEIASLMSDHAANPPADDKDDESDDGADDMITKVKPPMSLKKARSAAKAARLEKRTAKDQIAVAKARKTLTKIGRRNAASDQDHLDAADTHIGALGATFHQSATGRTPSLAPTELQKATNDEEVASVIDVIAKAVGPLIGKDLEAIRGELAQVSEQIAKVAKIPMPGGPRVVMDRDGSFIGAPDGTQGLSFEQAALAKVAERYPVGSVVREELQKAAATSAIKELMVARQQY